MIKAVLFDMDGVIFDTEAVWKKSFEESNKKFGFDLDENYRVSVMAGRTDDEIRKKLKHDFPDKNVDEYRDYMQWFVKDTIMHSNKLLKPGFLKIVQELKNHGIKIALSTSSANGRADILFKNHGLSQEKIFDFMLKGDDVTKGKPDPEIFLKSAKGLGVEPQECVVLEDSLLGVEAGHRAGMHVVMVVDLIEPDKKAESQANKIVHSLDEAKDYILKLI